MGMCSRATERIDKREDNGCTYSCMLGEKSMEVQLNHPNNNSFGLFNDS